MFHVKHSENKRAGRAPKKAENAAFLALQVGLIGPLVDAFLAKYAAEWTPTSLGLKAVKDPNKIFQIRAGTQVRAGTARKIIAVIDKHAPGFSHRFVSEFAKGKIK